MSVHVPYAHRVRYAYATYGTCVLIHAHTRFRRSQTISTVCVRHFSSLWVCRHTARNKTRGWRRSDADCRFRLFCSNRGQRVNPRLSVTVALCTVHRRADERSPHELRKNNLMSHCDMFSAIVTHKKSEYRTYFVWCS